MSKQTALSILEEFLQERGVSSSEEIYFTTGITADKIVHAAERSEVVTKLTKGFYAHIDYEHDGFARACAVANRFEGFLCLRSAATFHGLTTRRIPEFDVAREVSRNRLYFSARNLGLNFVKYRDDLCEKDPSMGIEPIEIFGRTVWITSPARTVIDLFASRSQQISLDFSIECLQTGISEHKFSVADLEILARKLGLHKSISDHLPHYSNRL